MEAPLLEVKNLKKYFSVHSGLFRRRVVKAVDGICFSIKRGAVLGIVGESGSGKSTAARAAIRLIAPSAGEILYNGNSFLALTEHELRRLRPKFQLIFQDPYSSLNPCLTVLDLIGEGLLFYQMVKNKNELKETVAHLLEQVGLSPDLLQRFPHQLSGGQQQRISIARAIAIKPELVICDEAVSALDQRTQEGILGLLMDLKVRHHLSYLFISHQLKIVRDIADDVAVMHKGKIVEWGQTSRLFADPHHPYTQELLEACFSIQQSSIKAQIPKKIKAQ